MYPFFCNNGSTPMAAARKRQRRKAAPHKSRPPLRFPLGSATPPLVDQGFTARITAEQAQALIHNLTPAPSLRALLEHMQLCCEEYDASLARIPFTPPFACKRGCSHCCFNQVSLSPAEAVFLGVYLLERLSEAKRRELHQRIRELLPKLAGKSIEEIGAMRHLLPCVLLEDGLCCGHTARPFVCRGWNSVNAEQCRLSVANRAPMALIENHALPRDLAQAMQHGLLQGATTLGLEAGFLLLPRALHLMLEHGPLSCGETWLQGGEFFRKWREVRV